MLGVARDSSSLVTTGTLASLLTGTEDRSGDDNGIEVESVRVDSIGPSLKWAGLMCIVDDAF